MKTNDALKKGLVILLVDCSQDAKACCAVEHANELLSELCITCSHSRGIRELLDIGVLGYSGTRDSQTATETLLFGPLAERELVSVTELAQSPVRVESRSCNVRDEDTGESLVIEERFPVWVEPSCTGSGTLSEALQKTARMVGEWIEQHQYAPAPLIINISSGFFDHGGLEASASQLTEQYTSRGNAVLWNNVRVGEVSFMRQSLHWLDNLSRLYGVSSVLPKVHRYLGGTYAENVRCFSVNSDSSVIVDLIATLFAPPLYSGPLR